MKLQLAVLVGLSKIFALPIAAKLNSAANESGDSFSHMTLFVRLSFDSCHEGWPA